MDFEWDEQKSEGNIRKHGVSFDDAATVFNDPFAYTTYDPDHSLDEDREITIGQAANGRIIIISHTDRGNAVRIISARYATRSERKEYEDVNFP